MSKKEKRLIWVEGEPYDPKMATKLSECGMSDTINLIDKMIDGASELFQSQEGVSLIHERCTSNDDLTIDVYISEEV